MPRGLKETSGLIIVGFNQTESALNTFTQARIDLQLNVLDREVFVVYGVQMDISPPDAQAAVNSSTFSSISNTSRTTVGNIGSPNVLAASGSQIKADAAGGFGVGFEFASADAPATQLEYLGIIATNDFFVQIEGANNLGAKTTSGRIYGVRAVAEASVFAALTQSELLSA
jgi:hypothetical protein